MKCTSIPGEALLTEHSIVRQQLASKVIAEKKKQVKKRIKTRKLKIREYRLMFEEAFNQDMESGDRNWKNIQEGGIEVEIKAVRNVWKFCFMII